MKPGTKAMKVITKIANAHPITFARSCNHGSDSQMLNAHHAIATDKAARNFRRTVRWNPGSSFGRTQGIAGTRVGSVQSSSSSAITRSTGFALVI